MKNYLESYACLPWNKDNQSLMLMLELMDKCFKERRLNNKQKRNLEKPNQKFLRGLYKNFKLQQTLTKNLWIKSKK